MSTRRGWWRRLMVPLLVCAMSVAMAGIAVPSATAAPASTVKTVPVQQLSNRVLKLIKTVEGSTLACPTRNAVVRGLRLVDDALLSGRRSAARAFAQAWTQHAWSLESGRVLSPEVGSAVQTQLGGMVDQIGFGWSVKPGPTRHWKPLPSCDSGVTGVASGAGAAASGTYVPYAATDLSSDIEIIVGALVSYVPYVGNLLYAMTYLMWPVNTTTDSWSQLAPEDIYNLVSKRLGELKGLMTGSDASWTDEMTAFNTACPDWSQTDDCITAAGDLWTDFQIKNSFFITYRTDFQAGQTTTGLDLLPLFAQYETMYLSLLRDGMLLYDHYWAALGHGDLAGSSMFDELNPNPTDSGKMNFGVHYVTSMYTWGLDNLEPEASASDWAARNAYIRTETLTVLDARDTWKYLDPRAYPDGVPGGVKLTRMIYSDPVGVPRATPNPPASVAGPLREIAMWTKPVGATNATAAISSVQATSPPLLGPAQSGAVQGDAADTGKPNSANYFNLAARGPIITVKGQKDYKDFYKGVPTWIEFSYVDGSRTGIGDYVSPYGWDPPNERFFPGVFHYDGEVLVTAHVASSFHWSDKVGDVADGIVFGFRYADSFSPAGEVIGVGSGKCLDVPSLTNGKQAVIQSCAQPPGSRQIWTYDPGLQQLSITDPAVNPADNPNNVQGKFCLDTAGDRTTAGTAVVIDACNDNPGATTGPTASSQRWTVEGVGAGIATITNVKSGMVVEVPNDSSAEGTGLQLAAYLAGDKWQQWQASDPSTGEIHGIGSGRCVDVPNGVTTPGTQVQILDCNGAPSQQWTYNPSYKMLFYAQAPYLCLTARDGGTSSGTAVEINSCTGAAEQKWTLHGNGGPISNDKSGLVLSVPGAATANHTPLQLLTANGTAAQQWSRTSTQGGALYSVGAGQCLTAPTSGPQLEMASCSSPPTAAQTWTYHPAAQTFTVDTGSGPRCLDGAGGATTTGTLVVINACTGAASQRWARDFSHSTITNINSGLVLDISYAAKSSGTLVLSPLKTDSQGNPMPTPTQKWVWSLS